MSALAAAINGEFIAPKSGTSNDKSKLPTNY